MGKKRVRDNSENIPPEAEPGEPATAAPTKPMKVHNIYSAQNKEGISIPATEIAPPKAKPADHLRIASWNINGLRAFLSKRSKELKKFWDKEQLDILGITEHKITDEATSEEATRQIQAVLGKDVEVVWNLCTTAKGYSGTLAILKKSLLSKCKVHFGLGEHETDPEGRVITLEFPTLAVVVCYVPNSGMELKRLQYRIKTWDKALSNHCLSYASEGKGVLLAGDLNVAHRDMDIWNVDAPHVPKGAGTTPEERASFEKHYLNRGFTDTFVAAHPDATGWFTYWSVRAGNKPKNRGLRLDYVLSAGSVEVKEAFVLPEFAVNGDHAPVGVTVASRV